MSFLVALAAFFQQFGWPIMFVALLAIIGSPLLQQRGKWRYARWTALVAMVLSGILAFSQITLGIVVGDMVMLVFGLICCWPMVSNFRFLRNTGFWHRFRRRPRPRKPPKRQEPKKPMLN